MPLRLIEVFSASGHIDTIAAVAERYRALDFRRGPEAPGATEVCRILARPEQQQELIDQLQATLGKEQSWRITLMTVDATIPELAEPDQPKRSPEQATREELYAEIDRGSRIDSTFLLLVVLSTIVAAIGLLESNVAIVIAAMLIAPLLGPNVAMAFGSILGDEELILRAAATNAAGLALSIVCAAAAGVALPEYGVSAELVARTQIGYDSILLALASGAAGALSLTTRLPSALVGVMVAVALLPPARRSATCWVRRSFALRPVPLRCWRSMSFASTSRRSSSFSARASSRAPGSSGAARSNRSGSAWRSAAACWRC